MKQKTLELFEKLGHQVASIVADESLFLNKFNDSPDTKYRMEFFQAIKSLGVSNEVSARVALAVQLDVNQFDLDVCKVYVDKCFIPLLKAILENKSKLDITQHLSDEEALVSYARGSSLTYKV